MILIGRRPFAVSRYHERQNPEMAASSLARGPVFPLKIHFEHWMGGRLLDADAFIDPGADNTILSLRWILEQGGNGRWRTPRRAVQDPRDLDSGLLDEGATVEIGGRELALGAVQRVRVMSQPPMPGFEDILLGRDFLAAHGLLFVLDGQDGTFSMLLPIDQDNWQRRERILAELSPPPG